MRHLLVLLFFCSFCSCATYYIPVENFRHQFAGIDSTRLRPVKVNFPVVILGVTTDSYLANPIDTIECFEVKGRPVHLANSPSIEIRFTELNGNSRSFYFDTVCLQDSLILGARSRFIPGLRDAIPISKVTLIEVQDGKKDFHYVK